MSTMRFQRRSRLRRPLSLRTPATVAIACAMCAAAALAQEECEVQEIVVGSASGPPGAEVRVDVLGGVSCLITGFSAAIGHNPDVLTFVDAAPGVFLVEHAGADLSFQVNGQNADGYAVVGAIFDISFPITVAPTTIERGTPLAILTYRVAPDAVPGTTVPLLNRTQTFGGAVLVSNIYSRPPGGVPIQPLLVDGEVTVDAPVAFRRSDSNGDAAVDISDPLFVFHHLFLVLGPALECEKAADANDDGVLELTDAIVVLNFLFLGGEPPAPPLAVCGEDPTGDALGCGSFAGCD